MDNSFTWFIGFIVGLLVGFVLMGIIDSQFESASCEALERKTGINLAYTYNKGCVRAEDL